MNTYSKNFKDKAVIAIVGAVALAADSAAIAAPLAEMVVGSDYVEWIPVGAAGGGSYTLSVSTPSGAVVKNSFSLNEVPLYPATADDMLENGGYAYELFLNPALLVPSRSPESAADQAVDKNGRPRGAYSIPTRVFGAGSQSPSQYGYFTVVNGIVVNPDIEE